MSDCRFGVSPVNYLDPLPYHISLGDVGVEKSPSLPYSRLPYPALLCPSLPYAILPSLNHFLPSTPLHYLTLPSPQLPSHTPLHYSTTPTPFPTLSSHLLYSPTIPYPPFILQLTYSTLQSPLPHPSHLFPSLPSPRRPYLPYSTLPPLLY